LEKLDVNQDQLIVIAILIGTDYNSGIKGVGPKTALRLVHQHKSFNKIFKEVKADFNWKEIYAIFKRMPIIENYQLKWKKPDANKINKILVEEHNFSKERVEKVLNRLLERRESDTSLGKWI
jgi:flap endonuclease-1